MVGIDYSEKAIELSRSIAQAKSLEITYQVVDVLDASEYEKLGKFDVGIDKGTYDAIALCPDDPKAKRHAYKAFLVSLLEPNRSIFVITSCNWTREELTSFFTQDRGKDHTFLPFICYLFYLFYFFTLFTKNLNLSKRLDQKQLNRLSSLAENLAKPQQLLFLGAFK